MAFVTRITGQRRSGMRGTPIKSAISRIRQHPGSQTSASQQAIDSISSSIHCPRY